MSAVPWLAMAAALLLARPPGRARLRAMGLATHGPAGGGRHRGRGGAGWSWRRRLPMTMLPAGTAGAAFLVAGPVVAAVTAGCAAWAVWLLVAGRARRRDRARRRTLLAAVRALVADLEAGSPPAGALQAAAGVAADFAGPLGAAAAVAAIGGEVAGALRAEPDLAPLADAWELADRSGAPVVDALTGVAADLAAATDRQHAVAVALAGPRATAVLLAVLPAAGLLLGSALGARPLTFLLDTTAGHACWCAALILDALGLGWTARLLRRAEAG